MYLYIHYCCVTLYVGYSRKGAALHTLKRYDEAYDVYQEGLERNPTDTSLQTSLNDVKKIIESRANINPPGGAGGAGGGLFGPQLLSKLVGHPKFGPKLADPAFMSKLQLLNTNPQLIMQDPELMEVLQILLGDMGGGGGAEGMSGGDNDDDYPTPTFEPPQKKPTQPEPVYEEDLTAEETEIRANKKKALTIKEQGNTYYKAKQFDEAISAYDQAFKLDPTNAMYLNNKAAVLIEQGKPAEAIAQCEEALELGKQYRMSFEDKAKIYHRIAAAHLKLVSG